MKQLHAWLDRESRRSAHRPTLEEALLSERAAGYLVYRLRYVGARVGLRTVLHLAEIALFAQVVWPEFLAYFLIVRSSCALFSTLYWGALEQLREDVRAFARARRWSSVRGVIDRWLWIAAGCIVVQFVGLAWFIRYGPSPFTSFSILDVYAIACVGRLACDTLARTYHSGMFALRRIHRPLASLMVPDVLDVLGLLILWPWLGPWSFGVVLFAVGLLRAGLTLYYTRAAYRTSRIPPLEVPGLRRALGRLREVSFRNASRHALANTTAQLDALVILVLVANSRHGSETLGMAALFHVLRPLLSSGFAWSRLFYFDLKRLSTRVAHMLRARFERLLRRLSLVLATLLGVLVIVLVPLFGFPIGPFSTALLLPFLGVRSLFALYQLQAFTYMRHDALLRAGLVVVLGLIAVSAWQPPPALLLMTLIAVLGAAMLLGGSPTLGTAQSRSQRSFLNVPTFLARLTAIDTPVQLWVGQVDRRLIPAQRVAASLLAEPAVLAVTRWGRHQWMWMTGGDMPETDLRSRLLATTAGCLLELKADRAASDGPSALESALRGGLWSPALCAILTRSPQDLDPRRLVEDFHAQFSEGLCLDSRGRLYKQGSRSVSRTVVRRIVRQLDRLADGDPLRRAGTEGIDVAVYAPAGEAQLIFVMHHATPSALRHAWRRRVWQASLQASLSDGLGQSIQPSVDAASSTTAAPR